MLLIMPANGTEREENNDFVELQSGSLLGLGHASYGYKFYPNHGVLFGLGYVPELSHHKEMFLFSLRYKYDANISWEYKGYRFEPLNLGVGFLLSEHDDLFLELPSKYPDGYYAPSALRIVFNYQAAMHVSQSTKIYFDISVLDVGLVSYIREPEFFYDNYDYLGLEGITNWGFGVRYDF